MRKLSINLSEKQYQKIQKEIKKGMEVNFNEETFSGFKITLNVIEEGVSWVDFKMLKGIEIGEVLWQFD